MREQHYFLYKIQPVRPAMLTEGPTADEERIIGEHFRYLQALTEESVVKLAGRTLTTDYSSLGICIFVAEDEAAARALVENDPAVMGRVMRAEVYPYRVALLAEKWGIGE
ncbi:MAG: YciI family protein [Caldilineaceae bacterium]